MAYNNTLTEYAPKKTKQCVVCKHYFEEFDIDEEVCRTCEQLNEGDKDGEEKK
jgi:hypothetical protein